MKPDSFSMHLTPPLQNFPREQGPPLTLDTLWIFEVAGAINVNLCP